jgi:hypothetical protein
MAKERKNKQNDNVFLSKLKLGVSDGFGSKFQSFKVLYV